MARSNGGSRLDDAARAGWLYYVAGNTQDEIAHKLGVSRQSAQRLVSLAVSEKLIKFRLDHPIARCMELSGQLSQRFGLQSCEIVPTDPGAPESITGVAIAGAAEMQKHLDPKTPRVIAGGDGTRPARLCRAVAVDGLPAASPRFAGRQHDARWVSHRLQRRGAHGRASRRPAQPDAAPRAGAQAGRTPHPAQPGAGREKRLGCASTPTRPSSGSAISMARHRSRWTGSSPMRKAGHSSAWARWARSSAGSSMPEAR